MNGSHHSTRQRRTERKIRRGRVAKASAVLIATSALGQILIASPAQASPFDCAQAQGAAYASQCIEVGSDDTNVYWVRSTYEPGVSDTSSPTAPFTGGGVNVCGMQHEVMYTPASTGEAVTLHANLVGCTAPVFNNWMDWHDLGEMVDGSQICTRANNNATGHQWTPWACREVKTDDWLWGF